MPVKADPTVPAVPPPSTPPIRIAVIEDEELSSKSVSSLSMS